MQELLSYKLLQKEDEREFDVGSKIEDDDKLWLEERPDIGIVVEDRTHHMLHRLFRAMQILQQTVEIDPRRRGGTPVLRGTRFKASQLIAQIAEGDSIDDLEEDLGLDREVMQQFLKALSICLDRRWTTPR